jgi:hypothetical protein
MLLLLFHIHTVTKVCFFSFGREQHTLSTQQTEELEEARSFRHGIVETSENGTVFSLSLSLSLTHARTRTHTDRQTDRQSS